MTNNINAFGNTNIIVTYVTVSAPLSIPPKLSSAFYNITTASSNITLPAPNAVPAGWSCSIKNTNAAANSVIASSGTIDGAPSISLNQYGFVNLVSDGVSLFMSTAENSNIQLTGIKTVVFPATGIQDGLTAFTRTTLASFRDSLELAATNGMQFSWVIPNDYVSGTNLTVTVNYCPKTVAVGNYVWQLAYQSLSVGDVITSVPTLIVQTTASSTIVNSLQKTSFTIPSTTLAVGDDLGMLMQLFTLPIIGDNALVLDISINYTAYI